MVLYLIIEDYHEANMEVFTTVYAFWQVVTQARDMGISNERKVS